VFVCRPLAAAVLVCVLTACGGSSSPTTAGQPTTPAPETSPTPSPSPSSGPYASTVFSPAFTVLLPPGWTVAERDEGAAQLYKQCDTCTHGGEENGEITLDMGLQKSSIRAAADQLRKATNVVAGPLRPIKLGELSGLAFTATRTGKGDVQFQDSGYDTDPHGAPLQVYAVRVATRTMTVFLDPPPPGPAVNAFRVLADSVLSRMHFTA
jgi:hypothetical protein